MVKIDQKVHSGVATGVARGQSATPDSEKIAKNWEKEGKNLEKLGGKSGKSGKRKKNREVSFTLPLLTERLATLLKVHSPIVNEICFIWKPGLEETVRSLKLKVNYGPIVRG